MKNLKSVGTSFLLLTFLTACCYNRNVQLDPISFNKDSGKIITKSKIVLLGEGVSDDILKLAKEYNKNIKGNDYNLRIKYNTEISPHIWFSPVKNPVYKEGVNAGDDLGPLWIPIIAVGGVAIIVGGVAVGTYGLCLGTYQVLGGPWWTTATVAIDATLTYHSKEIGQYHTDGIPDKRLISCWYGQCSGDADKTAEATSFKLGLEEIFKQIQNDGGNQSKKTETIKEKEKADAEAAKAEEERLKKLQEEEKRKKQAFIQKYGKDFCHGINLRGALLYSQMGNPDVFNSNCIYDINGVDMFKVMQQTRDGTLVEAPGAGYEYGSIIIFIEKNSTDSNLVDGAPIRHGLLNPIGTYSYTNVLGARKTIYKFQRVYY